MSPELFSQIEAFVGEDRGVMEHPLHADELAQLLAQLPLTPPTEFTDWLRTANGVCLGHGGVYGLRSTSPCRNLAETLGFYESWVKSKWLPIGWDGFGNEFALNCDPASHQYRQVWFFEMASSEEVPQSQVAASLEEFFRYFFSAGARAGKPPPSQQRGDA